MSHQLTSPCATCYFRRDILFTDHIIPLTPDGIQAIAEALRTTRVTFQCHTTYTTDALAHVRAQRLPDGVAMTTGTPAADTPWCAGVRILCAKMGIPLAHLGATALDMQAPVFESFIEMRNHWAIHYAGRHRV